jgi:hypothetical protein
MLMNAGRSSGYVGVNVAKRVFFMEGILKEATRDLVDV